MPEQTSGQCVICAKEDREKSELYFPNSMKNLFADDMAEKQCCVDCAFEAFYFSDKKETL